MPRYSSFFSQAAQLSYHELLKLNLIEVLLLSQIGACPCEEQISKIKKMIESASVDLIVKLAMNNPEFFNVCLLPELADDWTKLWSTYGVVITDNEAMELYDQCSSNKFHLFLGIYFYDKALEISKLMKKDFSFREMSFLQIAISFDSIHAYQRLLSQLYMKVDINQNTYSISDSMLLKKAIFDVKKRFLSEYKSYAYLMLVELYVRYAQCLQDDTEKSAILTHKLTALAFEACERAKKLLPFSKDAIFNASLGGDLGKSNSLGLTDFEEIKKCLKTFFHVEEIEASVVPKAPTLGVTRVPSQ